MLTGLHLGGPEEADLTHARGEWARRASLETLLTDPAAFWRFAHPAALEIAERVPEPGHRALARLASAGFVSSLITQAVDHLHTIAGSTDVVEVHGNILTARCGRCGERTGSARSVRSSTRHRTAFRGAPPTTARSRCAPRGRSGANR